MMWYCKFEFRVKSIACCVVMVRNPVLVIVKVKENIDFFPIPLSSCNNFEELPYFCCRLFYPIACGKWHYFYL